MALEPHQTPCNGGGDTEKAVDLLCVSGQASAQVPRLVAWQVEEAYVLVQQRVEEAPPQSRSQLLSGVAEAPDLQRVADQIANSQAVA